MQKFTSCSQNYQDKLIQQNLKQKKNSDSHFLRRKLRVGLLYMLVHRTFGEITLAEIMKLKIRHSCIIMDFCSSMDLVLVFLHSLEILHFHQLIVAQKTFKPKQINMGSHMDLIIQFLRQILQHCLEIRITGKLLFFILYKQQKRYYLNQIFQFGVDSARSLINEFDSFVRLDLACILDEEDNCESAAEVKCTLDNLIAAYNARLDLESNYGKK